MALVCKIDEIKSDFGTIERTLKENDVPFESLCEVQVPSRHPITKKQYETWNSIWPLVFHESMDEKYDFRRFLIFKFLGSR